MKEFKINEFLKFRMFKLFMKKLKTLALCNDIDLDLYFTDLDYIHLYLDILSKQLDFRIMNFDDIMEVIEFGLYEE